MAQAFEPYLGTALRAKRQKPGTGAQSEGRMQGAGGRGTQGLAGGERRVGCAIM